MYQHASFADVCTGPLDVIPSSCYLGGIVRRIARVLLAASLLGCATRTVVEARPRAARVDAVVVLLPGLGDTARDVARHGVVAALHACTPNTIVLVQHGAWRLSADVLARDVTATVRRANDDELPRVVVVSISAGGRAVPPLLDRLEVPIDGVVLYAPEPNVLSTLARRSDVALLYGTDDRRAPALRELADHLPRERVFTTGGSHDWSTFDPLWRAFLRADPLRLCSEPSTEPDRRETLVAR